MGNVFFYRDSIDTFECDIKIEGASTSASKARLVLEFPNRSLLFIGEIRNGHVSVQVPKLSDIQESSGNATLEIIADQTFFEAWKSPFELKNKKSVSISEIKVRDDSSKLVIENVSKQPEKKPLGIYKDTCSESNRRYVTESFERFSSLSKRDKKQIKELIREFTPKPTVEKWAKSIFNDTSTPYARFCMYNLQAGSKKRL